MCISYAKFRIAYVTEDTAVSDYRGLLTDHDLDNEASDEMTSCKLIELVAGSQPD